MNPLSFIILIITFSRVLAIPLPSSPSPEAEKSSEPGSGSFNSTTPPATTEDQLETWSTSDLDLLNAVYKTFKPLAESVLAGAGLQAFGELRKSISTELQDRGEPVGVGGDEVG